jgi:hypothetical protein
MSILNKVTTLRKTDGISDADIQAHIDAENADSWYLVGVDNLIGWYRFFWAKESE